MHIAEEETLKDAFSPVYFSDEIDLNILREHLLQILNGKALITYAKKNKFHVFYFQQKGFRYFI